MVRPEGIDRDSEDWREASTLFGAYLHQDFDAVHGDAWSAVRDYVHESNEDQRSASASSVRQLLRLSDGELERTVDHFGMAYYPPGDGYSSYRLWLTAVADFLEDPETHAGPPERDAPVPKSQGAGGRMSTFTDREVAERAVAENLRVNSRAVADWAATAGPNRAFECRHGRTVGRLAPPEATLETIHDVDRSRVVLRQTAQTAEGWFVMVAYPIATPDPTVAAGIDRIAPEWDPLWVLCAGYLHQDFDIHGGAREAVATFATEASSEQRRRAAAAVRRLLDGADEHHLSQATEWLGMDYYPPGDGLTYRGWLDTVAADLER